MCFCDVGRVALGTSVMALCHALCHAPCCVGVFCRGIGTVLLTLCLFFSLSLSIVLLTTQNSTASSLSRTDWECTTARDPHRLVVKFHEDTGLQAKDLEAIYPMLVGQTKALFTQSTLRLEKAYQRLRMGGRRGVGMVGWCGTQSPDGQSF